MSDATPPPELRAITPRLLSALGAEAPDNDGDGDGVGVGDDVALEVGFGLDAIERARRREVHAALAGPVALALAEVGDEATRRDVSERAVAFFERHFERGVPRISGADAELAVLEPSPPPETSEDGRDGARDYRVPVDEADPGAALLLRVVAFDPPPDARHDSRRLWLDPERPLAARGSDYVARFVRTTPPRGPGRRPSQRALLREAESQLLGALPPAWREALSAPFGDGDSGPPRSRLGHHLDRFARPPDGVERLLLPGLAERLRSALEVEIGASVLVPAALVGDPAEMARAGRVARITHGVVSCLVACLARAETRRVALVLAPKPVLSSAVVVPLGALPADLRGEVEGCAAQRAAWMVLLGEDGTRDEEARERWPVDTGALPAALADRVRDAVSELAAAPTARVVLGDNADAMRLLRRAEASSFGLAYTDPPYNRGGDPLGYHDEYSPAAWDAMIRSRLEGLRALLRDDAAAFLSIDEGSFHRLDAIGRGVFGDANRVGEIAVCLNPKGRQLGAFFATSHEHLLVFARDAKRCRLDPTSADAVDPKDFPLEEDGVAYRLLPLRNTNKRFNPGTRPNLHYPLYVNTATGAVAVDPGGGHDVAVTPVFGSGAPAVWRWGRAKAAAQASELIGRHVRGKRGERWDVYQKDYCRPGRRKKLRTLWGPEEAGTTDAAVAELKALGGRFSSPKPTRLIRRLLGTMPPDVSVIDVFAGSGSTGAAVLLANRADGGTRKVTLVEGGAAQGATLRRRLERMMVSPIWRDGRPSDIGAEAPVVSLRVDTLARHADLLAAVAPAGQPPDRNTISYGLGEEGMGLTPRVPPIEAPLEASWGGSSGGRRVDLVATFGAWMGLRRERRDGLGLESALAVHAVARDGARVMVLWREVSRWPAERLPELLARALARVEGTPQILYGHGPDWPAPGPLGEGSWAVRSVEEALCHTMSDMREWSDPTH